MKHQLSDDYATVGVSGVTDDNLDAINARQQPNLTGADVDSADEIATVVDGVLTDLIVQSAVNDGNITNEDLINAGVIENNLTDEELSTLTSLVANADPAPETLDDLKALVDEAIAQVQAVADLGR